jgi:hypothetical protein
MASDALSEGVRCVLISCVGDAFHGRSEAMVMLQSDDNSSIAELRPPRRVVRVRALGLRAETSHVQTPRANDWYFAR